jgi:hypothetical protein
MAVENKRLSKGVLSENVYTSICVAPTDASTYIKHITLHNTDSHNQQINICYNGTGSLNKIWDIFLSPRETITISPEFPYILNPNEILYGIAGSTKINYIVHGREEEI